MATVTVEVPESAFSALRRSPDEFAREMRVAAAIQWYHQELISQGKAAEIAGLSRADFLDALFRAKVPACQITVEELKEELETWQRLSGESSTARPDLVGQNRATRLTPLRRTRSPRPRRSARRSGRAGTRRSRVSADSEHIVVENRPGAPASAASVLMGPRCR